MEKDTFREGEMLSWGAFNASGDKFEWSIKPGNSKYSGTNPKIELNESGDYTIELTVYDKSGNSRNKSLSFHVAADTLWRLTNNSTKIWKISSINYSGTELVNEDCKKDDEFIITKSNTKDTFLLTEGKNKCPEGSYIFSIPASGEWRYNSQNKTLQFALTAFGSPYNFDLITEYISKDSFSGYDQNNGVRMQLRLP